MIIKNSKYFHLKIEDIKWKRNDKGDIFIQEWIGYGPISIPFTNKTVFLKRDTRKPIFKRLFENKTLEIDVREYLKNHLNYLQDKELE